MKTHASEIRIDTIIAQLQTQEENIRYASALKHSANIRDTFDLVRVLNIIPPSQRFDFAKHISNTLSLGGQSFVDVIAAIPENNRLQFAEIFFEKIDNPYVFYLVAKFLPAHEQFYFITHYYPRFDQDSRYNNALHNLLRILPADFRLRFAEMYQGDITQSYYPIMVLRELNPEERVKFIYQLVHRVDFERDIIGILELLPANERLKFYATARCQYVPYFYQILDWFPTAHQAKAMEINKQHLITDIDSRGPLYDRLNVAIRFIELEVEDEKTSKEKKKAIYTSSEKQSFYQAVSTLFKEKYATEVKPLKSTHPVKHGDIRAVENKVIRQQLINQQLDKDCANVIMQYSNHFFDESKNKTQSAFVKSCMKNELAWQDLIFLHQQSLGLRAVTDEEMLENEKKHGGRGDAVSLARFGQQEISLDNYISNADLCDEKTMDVMYPSRKAELLEKFKQGMKQHIANSLGMSLSPAYELIYRRNALHSYKFHIYPLGKCGIDDFINSQIITSVARMEADDWNVESIYHSIVTEIKRLSGTLEKTAELETSPPAVSSRRDQLDDDFYHRCDL